MSEPGHATPIALLYESREGGEHLRSALASLGASIVYEATAAELDRERLAGSQASVVVAGDAKTFQASLKAKLPALEVIPVGELDLESPTLRK